MKIKIIGLIMFIVFTSCKVETKDSTNTTIKTSKINTAETKILSVSKKLLVTALNGLSIRDTLSLSGEKIGKLLYEDTVEVIEETNEELQLKDGKNLISGKWIKIKIPKTNNAGYAFGGFLNELDNKVPHMKHHLKYRLQHLISTKLPIKDSVEYEKKEPSYVLNKTEWQGFGFNA